MLYYLKSSAGYSCQNKKAGRWLACQVEAYDRYFYTANKTGRGRERIELALAEEKAA
jgi:hypothetical protein